MATPTEILEETSGGVGYWRDVEVAHVPDWPCQPYGPHSFYIRGVWSLNRKPSDARTRAKESDG